MAGKCTALRARHRAAAVPARPAAGQRVRPPALMPVMPAVREMGAGHAWGHARSAALLLDVSDDEVPQAHADVPAFAFPGEGQRDVALGDDRGRAGLDGPWLAETLKGLRSPEGLARIEPGAALKAT